MENKKKVNREAVLLQFICSIFPKTKKNQQINMII